MIKNNKLKIFIGIVLLGFILRTPITGVGPIISNLKEILKIDNTQAGLITTIPLIAFALISPFAFKLADKIGLEKTLFLSSIIIFLGLLLRFYIETYTFFIATFIIGSGIAIGNVLLPGIVKKYYANNLGVMTGVYTLIISGSASFAAAISYPIATANIGSKNFSLALSVNIWIILAIITIYLYFKIYKENKETTKRVSNKVDVKKLLKNSKIYTLILTMGLQSAIYYCSVSWFPEIMISKGFSSITAGYILSISQILQIPATFFTPLIAEKIKNKLVIPTFIFLCYSISLLGIIFTQNNFYLMLIWMLFFALGGGGIFSYVMLLFTLKTNNSDEASSVSGITQAGGYLIAAIFPPILGFVKDRADWNTTLYLLLVISLIVYFTLIHCSLGGKILKKEN